MKTMKTALIIVLAAALISVLTACSGVVGGDTTVRISTDSSIGGRYISTVFDDNPNAVGYVAVLEGSKVYSVNELKRDAYYELVNGNIVIANLPPGDYIFGIALLDDQGTDDEGDDENYGLAIKEVTIKKGFNDVVIEVGPGVADFNVEGIGDIDNPLLPEDGTSFTFEEDTVIIDYARPSGGVDIDFDLQFGDATNSNITGWSEIGGAGSGLGADLTSFTVSDGASGLSLVVDGGAYNYRIILK